jgi:hypothetical protein
MQYVGIIGVAWPYEQAGDEDLLLPAAVHRSVCELPGTRPL